MSAHPAFPPPPGTRAKAVALFWRGWTMEQIASEMRMFPVERIEALLFANIHRRKGRA